MSDLIILIYICRCRDDPSWSKARNKLKNTKRKKNLSIACIIYIYIHNVTNSIIVYLYIVSIFNNDAMVILQKKKHTTDESRRQIQHLSMAVAWGLWHSAQLRPDYWRSQPGWSKMLLLYGIFIWCIYIYIYIYYVTCNISEHTKRQKLNKRTWDQRFKLRNIARSSSFSWFCVYAGHEQSRLASRRTDVRQIRDVQRLPWCHSVCVCNICIDVKLLPFFPSVLSLLQPSFRNLNFILMQGATGVPGGSVATEDTPPGPV